MDSYQLSIVLENVQLPAGTKFSFEIRLPEFDWCAVGTFFPGDLPSGSQVNLPLHDSFIDCYELKLDARLKTNDVAFSGTLVFQKSDDHFNARGITVLFDEKSTNNIILVSFFFLLEKILPPAPPEPPQMVATWCQTEKTAVRDAESQVLITQKEEKGVGTGGILVDGKQLEKSIQAAVEVKMRDELEKLKETGTFEKKGTGGDIITKETKSSLGWNVVPRLQKLSVLDQMIGNRERLLGAMKNTLRHSEVRRKMEFIKNQRINELKPSPKKENTSEIKEKPPKPTESATKRPKPPTSASEGSETSTESSESSSESASESASTSSESDNNTVTEKKVRLKSPANEENSSVEDPFSPKNNPKSNIPVAEDEPLTPTSQYLKDLRERIIRERGKC